MEEQLTPEWWGRFRVYQRQGPEIIARWEPGIGMVETGTRGGKRTLESDPAAVLAHMQAVNAQADEATE